MFPRAFAPPPQRRTLGLGLEAKGVFVGVNVLDSNPIDGELLP